MTQTDYSKEIEQSGISNLRYIRVFRFLMRMVRNVVIGEFIYKSRLPEFNGEPLYQTTIARMFKISSARAAHLRKEYEKTLDGPFNNLDEHSKGVKIRSEKK